MSRSNNRSDRRRRRPQRPAGAAPPTAPDPRELTAPAPEPAAFHTSFPPEPLPARGEARPRAAAPRLTTEPDDLEGELKVGCPMLTRTKMALRGLDDRHVPRCSIAWAIHSEAEAAYCLLTEDLVDCWKAHPERVPALESLIAGEASAAD